jgi:outer membrane protein assembly factor BamB
MRFVLALILLAASAATAAGPAPIAVDPLWLGGTRPTIVWKATGEETSSFNFAQWDRELSAARLDDWTRERCLRARMVVLLDESIRRFAADTAFAVEARATMAGHLQVLGRADQANQCLRLMIDENPGNVPAAVRAIKAMLAATEADGSDFADQWLDFAFTRAAALVEAGWLRPADRLLETVYSARYTQARKRDRLYEAWECIDALVRLGFRDSAWASYQRAAVLTAAGRSAEAMRLYEGLGDYSFAKPNAAKLKRPVRLTAVAEDTGLQVRWRALLERQGTLTTGDIQNILDDALNSEGPLRAGDGLSVSAWLVADRALLAMPADARAALAAAQQGPAQMAAAAARDFAAATRVFRQYPFAPAVHDLMLREGERALRRGEVNAAMRMFQDVLAHAADAGARQAAARGVELAASTPVAAAGAMPSLGPGGLLTAPPAAAWATDRLDEGPSKRAEDASIALPSPHQRGLLVFSGGHTMLAGATMLAVYGTGSQPLWYRTAQVEPQPPERPSRRALAYGPVLPLCDGQRIYARWGRDRGDQLLIDLACFDANSGSQLWTTATAREWNDLLPISDPVLADGRLYLLAAGDSSGMAEISLVCVAPDDGHIIFRQRLAAVNVNERLMAYLYYGNPVTVSEGAVYCSTSAGALARCDSRDGSIEWIRSYSFAQTTPPAEPANRQGMAPAVFGEVVAFAPRDAGGMIGLNRATGETAWDRADAPCDEPLGSVEGRIIVASRRNVAAVSVATGQTLWQRPLDDGASATALAGRSVLIGGAAGIRCIDAASGAALAVQPAPAGLCELADAGGRLVALPAIDPPHAGERIVPQEPAPAEAAFGLAWRMDCPRPRLIEGPDGRFCVLSRSVLQCVQGGPKPAVLWRRAVPQGLIRPVWRGDRMLLVCREAVAAVDAATGKVLWQTAVEVDPRDWWAGDKQLIVRQDETLLAISLDDGRLLWRRNLRPLFTRYRTRDVAVDGEKVYAVGLASRSDDKNAEQVTLAVLSATDGGLLELRPARDGKPYIVSGGVAIYAAGGELVQEPLAGGNTLRTKLPQEKGEKDKPAGASGVSSITLHGGLIEVVESQSGVRPGSTLLVPLGKADIAARSRGGYFDGRMLVDSGSSSVGVTDLATGKSISCSMSAAVRRTVVDACVAGNRVAVISASQGGGKPGTPQSRIRLDLFERADGRWITSGELTGVSILPGRTRHNTMMANRALYVGGMLMITSGEGISAWQIRQPATQ